MIGTCVPGLSAKERQESPQGSSVVSSEDPTLAAPTLRLREQVWCHVRSRPLAIRPTNAVCS